jgi:signal transduction histidine kinase
MGRLFRKIFLTFWATILLISLGVAWGVSTYLEEYGQSRWQAQFEQEANTRLEALSVMLEHSGLREARQLMRQLGPGSGIAIQVTDSNGRRVMGRPPRPDQIQSPEDKQLTRSITAANGESYHLSAQMRATHPGDKPPGAFRNPFRARDPWIMALRISIALLVSAAVSAWLAWYLTRPVKILQAASRALADGDLDVRVGHRIKQRDEIADLGEDFDRMAERLQTLLLSQRQLLSDISHELRSPLARLRVAVQLAASKTGDLPELERIEKEVCRLDELVGEVLSLARMEATDTYPLDDYVELSSLLEHIVADANFEAQTRNCHIELHTDGEYPLQANAELLRRALENIVRNAVHYTATNTTVRVSLEACKTDSSSVTISVIDQGEGVPEKHLQNLFEPFFRLQAARDRKTGGFGLGLAIAARSFKLHGATIRASNLATAGLCIAVDLPLNSVPDQQN